MTMAVQSFALWVLVLAWLSPVAVAQWKPFFNKDFVGGDVTTKDCRGTGPPLTYSATVPGCQEACIKANGGIVTFQPSTGACFCKCQTGFTVRDVQGVDTYIYLPMSPTLASASTTPAPSALATPSATPGRVESCVVAVLPELASADLTCPPGRVVSQVFFASYGAPRGPSTARSCGDGPFAESAICHASASRVLVEKVCLGKSRCRLAAASTVFGDPCPGRGKRLVVQALCSETSRHVVRHFTAARGDYQSFTVPYGVSSVEILLYGAGGGSMTASVFGGAGAFVRGFLPVTGGETLRIVTGKAGMKYGPGNAQDSLGGGGDGYELPNGFRATGGGGRSAIQRFNASLGAWEDVVTAGGGGGGCFSYTLADPKPNGGAASWRGPGRRGTDGVKTEAAVSGVGGGGGGPSFGGAATDDRSNATNASGGQYIGGSAYSSTFADSPPLWFDAAGGGGYYGGGAGRCTGQGGGGGGGSSYTANLVNATGDEAPADRMWAAPGTDSPFYLPHLRPAEHGRDGLVTIVMLLPPFNASRQDVLPSPLPSSSPSVTPLPLAASPKEYRCVAGSTAPIAVTATGALLISSPQTVDSSAVVNLDCGWSITAPIGHVVSLPFLAYNALDKRDYISLFDGPSVASRPLVYLQSAVRNDTLPPVFTSSGRSMFLRLQSADFKAGRGVIAAPIFLPRSTPGAPLDPPPASGSVRCSPGQSKFLIEQTGAVIVTDPGFPSGGGAATVDCSILIRAPFGRVIAIAFANVTLRQDADTLTIFEGEAASSASLLVSVSIANKPIAPVISAGSSVFFRFQSSDFREQVGRGVVAVVTFVAPPRPSALGGGAFFSSPHTMAINQINGWAAGNMRPSPSVSASPSASMLPKAIKTVLQVTMRITGPPNWDAQVFLRSSIARDALLNATAIVTNITTSLLIITSAVVKTAAASNPLNQAPASSPAVPLQPMPYFSTVSAALLDAVAPVSAASGAAASSGPSSLSNVGAGDSLVIVVGISVPTFGTLFQHTVDASLLAALFGTGNFSSTGALMRRARALQQERTAAVPPTAAELTAAMKRALSDGMFLSLYGAMLGQRLAEAEAAATTQREEAAFGVVAPEPPLDPSLQAFRALLQSGELVAEMESAQAAPGPGAEPSPSGMSNSEVIATAVAVVVFVLAAVGFTIWSIRKKNQAFAEEHNKLKAGRSFRSVVNPAAGDRGAFGNKGSEDSFRDLPPSKVPASVMAARIGLAATSMGANQFLQSYGGANNYSRAVYGATPTPRQQQRAPALDVDMGGKRPSIYGPPPLVVDAGSPSSPSSMSSSSPSSNRGGSSGRRGDGNGSGRSLDGKRQGRPGSPRGSPQGSGAAGRPFSPEAYATYGYAGRSGSAATPRRAGDGQGSGRSMNGSRPASPRSGSGGYR